MHQKVVSGYCLRNSSEQTLQLELHKIQWKVFWKQNILWNHKSVLLLTHNCLISYLEMETGNLKKFQPNFSVRIYLQRNVRSINLRPCSPIRYLKGLFRCPKLRDIKEVSILCKLCSLTSNFPIIKQVYVQSFIISQHKIVTISNHSQVRVTKYQEAPD